MKLGEIKQITIEYPKEKERVEHYLAEALRYYNHPQRPYNSEKYFTFAENVISYLRISLEISPQQHRRRYNNLITKLEEKIKATRRTVKNIEGGRQK